MAKASKPLQISETDRIIIQQLTANARIPTAELARHVHLSESQCLRRLRELERADVIQQYVTIVNLSAVNLAITGIVDMRLGNLSKSSVIAFEQAIGQIPAITTCWHTSGDTNYSVAASVPDPPAYDRLLDDLTAINGVSIIRSLLVLRYIKAASQPVRPAASRGQETESVPQVTSVGNQSRRSTAGATSAAGPIRRKRLDEFDRRILDILSAYARIPNVELARRISLSPAPCLRRVRALERAGIIQQYTTVVNGDMLNLTVALVRVQFQRDHQSQQRLFEQRLLEIPEIRTALRTNGDCDYVLVIEAASLGAFERLLVDSLLTYAGIKGLQSAIRLRDCFDHTSRPRGVIPPPPADSALV